MYVPSAVPKGPHYLYIFQHKVRPWFKIGESRDPDFRRRSLGRKLRSKEYRKWTFENYYGCFYVEQAAIGVLKMFGFTRVHSADWFEIDQPTMDAAIVSIDELARSINVWEQRNASTDCVCYSGKPYGDYLLDTDHVTLGHVYEGVDGRVELIEVDLKEALARKKHWYEKYKRKMPEGLARLIAATDEK